MDSDIEQALKAADLFEAFKGLPPSHRREYLTWITAAKKDETRQNRIAKMIVMLEEKL